MISYDSPTYKRWEGRPEIACPPVPLSPHLLCRVKARGRHGIERTKQRRGMLKITALFQRHIIGGIYTVRNLNRFNSSIESIQSIE